MGLVALVGTHGLLVCCQVNTKATQQLYFLDNGSSQNTACVASILQGCVSIASCMQGGDCFGAFMQWGLPKGTLKDVWAAVAGDQGYLSQQQFVQCLYLMDNAKRVSLTAFPAAGLLIASFACGIPHNNDQSISQSVNQVNNQFIFCYLGTRQASRGGRQYSTENVW